jgi:hypothetical protein
MPQSSEVRVDPSSPFLPRTRTVHLTLTPEARQTAADSDQQRPAAITEVRSLVR